MTRANALPDGYHLSPHISIYQIQAATADEFDIPPMEMVSDRRARNVARPRQVAMYLSRELTPFSLPNIGRRFGNRDHTTVMHAIRLVERLIDEDSELASKVSKLRGCLGFIIADASVDKSDFSSSFVESATA